MSAVRIRALVFDVFNNLTGSGSIYDVADLAAESAGLRETLETSQVTGQMTMVLFVTEVRLADGKVWTFDWGGTKDEIEKLGFAVDDRVEQWNLAPAFVGGSLPRAPIK